MPRDLDRIFRAFPRPTAPTTTRTAIPDWPDDDGMEAAHLAGMEGGVDAYNDAIGSSLTGPPDCPSCLRPRVAGHHGCYCEDD